MTRFVLIIFGFVAISGGAMELDLAKLPPAAARAVDFQKDVWPILSERCVKCHGEEKQKGGFRLDERRIALSSGDNFAPNILPGKSAESPLIHFVAGLDPEMKMPNKGDALTLGEIGILRAWIDQGAVWPRAADSSPLLTHWAFQALRHPIAEDGIDGFIRAKLEEHRLALAPAADRASMIRRLSFDLIGLPPRPEEITAFVTDADPRAYEKLVDRLLASPRYGEHWARHWMDVARFAESDGFETNQARPNAWLYRDYVIGAFNADKRFDAFIREQIAGDAFGADAATGFLVAGARDIVKSPDPVLTSQQRADELHDILSNTATAFMGLTVGCARCHNHKFDPIPQTDYYSLKAIFAGVRHGERALPQADVGTRDAALGKLRSELAGVDRALAEWEPIASDEPERRVPVSRGRNSERFGPVDAKFVRFTVQETTQLEPCIDELEIFTAGPDPRNVALASAGAKLASSGDYGGNPFHKLEHINDGLYGNERSWISNQRGRGWVQIELPRTERIERVVWSRDRDEVPRYNDRLPTRYDIEVSPDGMAWQRVASARDRMPAGTTGAAEILIGRLSDSDSAKARDARSLRDSIAAQIAIVAKAPMVYAGTFVKPEETRRFHRGDPMQAREMMEPGGLSSFGGGWRLPVDAPEQDRRVALAKWIASPENPLTARVMVNRLWHYHFGTGLVDTPSDFGLNGGRPSHPQLLDWLASEFIARGWSVKQMQRLIVLSATYRQGTRGNEAAQLVDAGDRLLWRFPPRRLEAEAVRDSILAVSGQLDLREGGPGFDLFEPNGNYVKVYTAKTKFAAGDFRRMIYQAKPRVELDPLFGAFDCPDAGQSAPRRTSSTTPLQALNLLNSEFVVEQAGAFAERLKREAVGGVDSQVTRAFELALGRPPGPEEAAAAAQLVQLHGLAVFCRALYNASEFITVY